jgi:hypothetical protein
VLIGLFGLSSIGGVAEISEVNIASIFRIGMATLPLFTLCKEPKKRINIKISYLKDENRYNIN